MVVHAVLGCTSSFSDTKNNIPSLLLRHCWRMKSHHVRSMLLSVSVFCPTLTCHIEPTIDCAVSVVTKQQGFKRPHWPRARHGRGSSRRPDDDGLERVDWVGSSFSGQESPGRADRFDRQVSPGRSLGRLGLGPPRESLARFSSKDRSSSNPGSQRTSLEGRRAAGTAGHRSRSNSSESSMNMGPIGTIGAT